MPKAELVSAAEFARRQKISAEMVRKAKRDGVFKGALADVPGRKKPLLKYKLAVRYYEARTDPTRRKALQPTGGKKAKGGNGDGKKRVGDKSLVEVRTRSEKYKAADLKLKHEINAGLWVKKADIADKAFRAGRMARDALFNIPARTAALVSAESDQNACFKIIHGEVKQVLEDFIEQLSKLAEGG